MALIASCCSAALAAGCEDDPEQQRVVATFQDTTSALASEDWARLWELSAPEARATVTRLTHDLQAALLLVDSVYPPEARDEARRALGAELLEGVELDAPDAGPKLLSRLLSGSTVDARDGATDGRNASSVTIDGQHAVLHTSAGEEYAFVQTEEGWRSQLLGDLLGDDMRVAMLRESAAAVRAAEDARQSAWKASRDPHTPQGAYNLARAAASEVPPDAKTLYALLDAPARQALSKAMETARSAQKLVQRRTTRRQRKAGYEEQGLTIYVDVDSDRALYLAWAATPGFVSPLTTTSPPKSLDGDPSGGEVTILTEGGERVPMVADPQGFWHLAGAATGIETALVAPASRAYEALSAP
ncbi:MAG: hypothetical protein H6744_04545 [Deltaproteobacteria bacterium]|nr:hypothetical protein [Deltaproteobacteria bacterium]MCB9785944.1 hypothetical protein [Deltaproteobacteria bacterium]